VSRVDCCSQCEIVGLAVPLQATCLIQRCDVAKALTVQTKVYTFKGRAICPQAKGPKAICPQAKGPKAICPQAKGPKAICPQAKGPKAKTFKHAVRAEIKIHGIGNELSCDCVCLNIYLLVITYILLLIYYLAKKLSLQLPKPRPGLQCCCQRFRGQLRPKP